MNRSHGIHSGCFYNGDEYGGCENAGCLQVIRGCVKGCYGGGDEG